MKKSVPLELRLLNECTFDDEIKKEFAQLQNDFLTFVKKHRDNAKGKKAKFTIEVELKAEDPKHDYYSISTSIKKALPQPPATATTGIGDVGEEGQLSLFVRVEGSSYDTPRQQLIPGLKESTVDESEPAK